MTVNSLQPQPGFIPLNELDKLFYSWELLGYQAIVRTMFEFSGGTIDIDLLRQAYAVEMRRRPVLNARIDDSAPGKNRQIRWRLRSEIDCSTAVRACDLSHLAAEAAEEKVRQLQFDPFTNYSLRTDPAFFLVLCRMPGGTWRLLVFSHHGLADAYGISLLLKELFTSYNELAQGRCIEMPADTKLHAAPSPLLPKGWELARGIFGALGFLAGQSITCGFKTAEKIMYGRPAFQAKTAAVQRAIGPERLSRYFAAVKQDSILFNALLAAAQALAIERWKKARGEPCDLITMEVHQSLRTTLTHLHELSNRFAPFVIALLPRHRKNPKALFDHVRNRQEQAYRNRSAEKMVCLLWPLNTRIGFKTQRFWQNFIFNNPRIGDSSLVTNLGKLWPERTAPASIICLGDAEITACYIGGPPTPSIGSYFSYLVYRGSLFITFSYFEWAIPAAEANRFVNLLEDTLDELSGYL